MAQSYIVLALLAASVFCSGDAQGGDVIVDGQLEGENFGSFICQQKCSDQDDESVREIRDDTLFGGNHFGSCVCQQSCYGQDENSSHEIGQLKNMLQETAFSLERLTQRTITEDRMEAMLRSTEDEMKAKLQSRSSSVEVKMAAMTNKVESLQQTVDQLTQRTITEDRLEAMLQRMVSSIQMTMAAMTNKVDGLQQTVDQLTQGRLRITCPADFVFNLRANICFKLYTNPKTRAAASTACQNLPGANARLAVLDTQEKVQLVAEHLSAHYGTGASWNVWLGGRQEEDEGQWLWETGQEVTGPWGSEQPNNAGGNEDCLVIYRWSSPSPWLLYDASCSKSNHYICEY